MPHPGRNVDVQTLQGGTQTTTYADGRVTVTNGTVDGTRFIQEQSDVVSSPYDATGWRNPTSYHNRSFSAVYGNSGQYVTEKAIYPDPSILSNEYRGILPINSSWFPPSMPDLSSDIDVACFDALDRLLDQKVNLAQNLATVRETARLFSQITTELVDLYDIWHNRKSFRAWRNAIAKVPQYVLQYFYGISPTLADMHGAIDEVRNRASQGPALRFTVNGRKNGSFTDHLEAGFPSFHFTRRGQVKTKVSLTYVLDNEFTRSLSRLGVTNPAYVAWDLIPFSFVADQIVPIGNWLQNLTAAQGFTFLGGMHSQRISTKIRPDETSRTYVVSGIEVSASVGNSRAVQEWYTRGVYGSSPLPPVHIKNPLSSTHIAEDISLILTRWGI